MSPLFPFFLTIVIACGLSLFSKKHDIIACAFIALLVTIGAGFRTYGFDYEEYLLIIDYIFKAQVDDVESLVLVAKDPLFSTTVLLGKLFTEDPQDIFLLVALLSVGPKLLLALSLPRYRAIFLGLYGIFLAPGLEFAAIRAGMSIGFCGLLLIGWLSVRSRVGIAAMAMLSHISAIVPIGMFWLARPRRADVFVVVLLATAVATYLALAVFNIFSVVDEIAGVTRSDDYLYDKGTANNFFFPISTLLILALSVVWIFDRRNMRDISVLPKPLILSALLCATAVGAALPVSTFVIRILEFAWFFYLYAMVLLFGQERTMMVGSRLLHSGFAFWIALLVFVNLYRETWDTMAPAIFIG